MWDVDVYRNLHKKTWSIRDRRTGRLLGHTDNVIIIDAKFIVQPAGRQRVLREQRKNVHAFIRGKMLDSIYAFMATNPLCNAQVTYDPYYTDHFYQIGTKEAVKEASFVTLNTKGAFIPKDSSTHLTDGIAWLVRQIQYRKVV